MSNEVNEKLAKIFESFNDDCVSLSDSEAETYGITIQDYAQKHPDEVLNNYLNECLKCYEELAERIQACEDKIKDNASYVDENTPTVEAIPVEWIKNWAESGGSEPVDDFTDVDAYCDGYQKNVIECLLKAWDKENGRSK